MGSTMLTGIQCTHVASVAVCIVATLFGCREPPSGRADLPTARPADERRAVTLTGKELLGEHLFEDVNLSEPPGVSCASCHDPKRAFQGNNGGAVAAVARGSRE